MKNKTELKQLVCGLREKGFEIPKFKYEGTNFDESWYISEVVYRGIEDLGLEVYLNMGFYVSQHEPSLNLDDLCKGVIGSSLTPFVGYQSLFSEVLDDINPKEWAGLPNKVEGELKFLKEIEAALPKSEGMIMARNTQAFISDKKSWGKFYGDLVRQGNLRWFNSRGKRFPYVITTSDVLGDVGRGEGGLYFVSTDIANEPWKEQVVAYHERFCQEKSHKYALRKEIELAKKLGLEKEYRVWRESVSDLWKNGNLGEKLK